VKQKVLPSVKHRVLTPGGKIDVDGGSIVSHVEQKVGAAVGEGTVVEMKTGASVVEVRDCGGI